MKKTMIIGIYLSLCCSLTACGNSKDIAEYDIDSVLSNEVTYDEYVSEKTDGMKISNPNIFIPRALILSLKIMPVSINIKSAKVATKATVFAYLFFSKYNTGPSSPLPRFKSQKTNI